MSETIKNLISRRELLEDIENYNRTPDKSLLPGIFLKAGQYLEQKNMRRLPTAKTCSVIPIRGTC